MKHDTPEAKAAVQRATFERLTGKKPTEQVVELLLDPQLSDPVDEALAEVDTLERRERFFRQAGTTVSEAEKGEVARKLRQARAALEAAQAAAAAETVTLHFRQLRRTDYQDLVEAHEPTEEQREKGRIWNDDTFPPALVSASLVDPVLDVEQVTQLLEEWNVAEGGLLFSTALQVNTSRKVVDLGKDFGGTPNSTPSLPSATDGASPTPSS